MVVPIALAFAALFSITYGQWPQAVRAVRRPVPHRRAGPISLHPRPAWSPPSCSRPGSPSASSSNEPGSALRSGLGLDNRLICSTAPGIDDQRVILLADHCGSDGRPVGDHARHRHRLVVHGPTGPARDLRRLSCSAGRHYLRRHGRRPCRRHRVRRVHVLARRDSRRRGPRHVGGRAACARRGSAPKRGPQRRIVR